MLEVYTPEEFRNLCEKLGVNQKQNLSLFRGCQRCFFKETPETDMLTVHMATKLINIPYQDKLVIDNNSPCNLDIYIGYRTWDKQPISKNTRYYFTKEFDELKEQIKKLKKKEIKHYSSKKILFI